MHLFFFFFIRTSRNRPKTTFYYGSTVKCFMHVNPFGIVKRKSRLEKGEMNGV